MLPTRLGAACQAHASQTGSRHNCPDLLLLCFRYDELNHTNVPRELSFPILCLELYFSALGNKSWFQRHLLSSSGSIKIDLVLKQDKLRKFVLTKAAT